MRLTRLEWCKQRESWAAEDWEQVILSDESKNNLMEADGGARVRRRKDERYGGECMLLTEKNSPYITVWGAIKNMELYKDIVKHFVPTIEDLSQHTQNAILQDDSEPCHRAASVSLA